MRSGKHTAPDPGRGLHKRLEKAERFKASVRAKIEHPLRAIKQQFGFAKVRYRGLRRTQRD